jgi:hypothetical protein
MSDPPAKDALDGRKAPRRRVLLKGKLVYGDPPMTLDCAISDMSRGGARVRLEGSQPVTDTVYLIDVRHGRAFRSRVAWRRANLLGLAFRGLYDLRHPPPEAPKILRLIWVEQTRLGHQAESADR